MRVSLIAVGTRGPGWVEQGVAEYRKRLARELDYEIVEVPLARRAKNRSIEQCVRQEGAALLNRVRPGDFVVSLDVKGASFGTDALARRLQKIRLEGSALSLLAGGPDGLDPACHARAQESWSLSQLTLPHFLVRLLLTEQLYRAVSILKGHPYHRA